MPTVSWSVVVVVVVVGGILISSASVGLMSHGYHSVIGTDEFIERQSK